MNDVNLRRSIQIQSTIMFLFPLFFFFFCCIQRVIGNKKFFLIYELDVDLLLTARPTRIMQQYVGISHAT